MRSNLLNKNAKRKTQNAKIQLKTIKLIKDITGINFKFKIQNFVILSEVKNYFDN